MSHFFTTIIITSFFSSSFSSLSSSFGEEGLFLNDNKIQASFGCKKCSSQNINIEFVQIENFRLHFHI